MKALSLLGVEIPIITRKKVLPIRGEAKLFTFNGGRAKLKTGYGAQAGSALQRFQPVVSSDRYQPTKVVMAVGLNDLHQPSPVNCLFHFLKE